MAQQRVMVPRFFVERPSCNHSTTAGSAVRCKDPPVAGPIGSLGSHPRATPVASLRLISKTRREVNSELWPAELMIRDAPSDAA